MSKSANDSMPDFLITIFPNYKCEMYDGNMPIGRGHKHKGGGYFDRWETKYGGGEIYNGVIDHASFDINEKVTINIVGNHLQIIDARHYGEIDIFEYTNIPSRNLAWSVLPKYYHELEPERIEKILNTKIENCKFWDMVQARARELYNGGYN